MSTSQIIAEKDKLILAKDKELKRKTEQISQLQHQYKELLRLIYGSKSERFIGSVDDQSQLNLFEVSTEEIKEEQTEHISYDRKRVNKNHPDRHPLPDHLPVVEQTLEPEEETEGLDKIGEEITETLDYTPASLIKRRIVRPKYIDRAEDKIYIATLPERVIDKCIAEPGLLSHIMVNKYVDHLPLYRQAKQFARNFDWHVSRSTLNNWVGEVCRTLEPLYDSLGKRVLRSAYIQVDESPHKVLERKQGTGKSPPGQKKMMGYQWVYLSPNQKLVYFNYRKGRGQHGPKEILAGYEGYVQCDGYQVYDKIAKTERGIQLVGCLAHARRKFYEAKDSDKTRSDYAMDLFNTIYKLDSEYSRDDLQITDQRYKMRQEHIKPLFEKLLKWIKEESILVLPKSPIGKAMNYYQKQYPKLVKALDHEDLHLDNNWVENKIRPLALGRKNYLFAGSHQGAKWMSMMYSFFGTCQMHGVNPKTWLHETLEKIKQQPLNRIEELLPEFKEG